MLCLSSWPTVEAISGARTRDVPQSPPVCGRGMRGFALDQNSAHLLQPAHPVPNTTPLEHRTIECVAIPFSGSLSEYTPLGR